MTQNNVKHTNTSPPMKDTPTPQEGNSEPLPALQVARLLRSIEPAQEACEEVIRAALQRFYKETGFEPISLHLHRLDTTRHGDPMRTICVAKVDLTISTDPR